MQNSKQKRLIIALAKIHGSFNKRAQIHKITKDSLALLAESNRCVIEDVSDGCIGSNPVLFMMDDVEKE